MANTGAAIRQDVWQRVKRWLFAVYIFGAIMSFIIALIIFGMTTTSVFATLFLAILSALLWPLMIVGYLFG